MKTAKERDRAYSWNRMDSNLRVDTLRQVGVPEDFIGSIRGLDFNEIENSYPEIAEWLMDSAGLFNEPMFEDNVHSSIPLDQTHNISINDPNQYWNLTDIIGERKASEGEWEYSGVDLEDHMDIEEEGGRTYATCEHCGWHEEWDDSDRSGNAPVDVMSNHLSRKHGITESKSTEILGFDELLSEDLTYNEIVELTKGLPIDEIPEKLRHAGMKLQFDPDFKAGDNPYIGDWRESFSKELQALEEIQFGGRIMVDDHGKYFKEGY